MADYVRCLYCEKPASVTVTSELRGLIAHYPCCDDHVERAAGQMRSERGRDRQGLDPFTGQPAQEQLPDGPVLRRPLPGSVDAEPAG